MTPPSLAQLRAAAAAQTLWNESSVQAALDRFGFLQADPIRAPARAQDLMLMQRLSAYRAGDLERLYPSLDAEEEFFPNYGFVSRRVWALLHPKEARVWGIEQDAPGLMQQVLEQVRRAGELHPRAAGELFGRVRVQNSWGGGSNASTRALEALHRSGLLRVVRRESGVRVYALARAQLQDARTHAQDTGIQSQDAGIQSPDAQARLRELVLVLARLYAPASEPGLRLLVGLAGQEHPGLRAAFRALVTDGTLTRNVVDGLAYLWPTELPPEEAEVPSGIRQVAPHAGIRQVAPHAGIRLVAPFDPLVWDRRRFEHLHGWAYRLEAYTPPANRTLGYYALPMFQAERAVGWANLKVSGGELTTDITLIPGVRRTATFERSLRAELERYRAFLGLSA